MAKLIKLFERNGEIICWDSERKQLVAVQVETLVIRREAAEAIEALVDAAERSVGKEGACTLLT